MLDDSSSTTLFAISLLTACVASCGDDVSDGGSGGAGAFGGMVPTSSIATVGPSSSATGLFW